MLDIKKRLIQSIKALIVLLGIIVVILFIWRIGDDNQVNVSIFRGEGTEESPYEISSVDDLLALRGYVNQEHQESQGVVLKGVYFEQTCDIDLGDISDWEPISLVDSGSYFYGIYDGGGHVIKNLHCSSREYGGLFGQIGGSIINLGLEDAVISGDYCSGIAISSASHTASITNCFVDNITFNANEYASGIAYDFDGDIVNCWSNINGESKGIIAGICSSCYRAENNYTNKKYLGGAVIGTKGFNYETDIKKTVIALNDYIKAANINNESVYLWNEEATGVSFGKINKLRIPFDGKGTIKSPYLIKNVEEFTRFSRMVNNGFDFSECYFKLKSDLDMEGVKWTPIGLFGNGRYFCGTFDGAGHTISNLTVHNTYAGLFGQLSGTVQNLVLCNEEIEGTCIGGIASHSYGAANIKNCIVKDVTIKTSYRGGGIADNFGGGTITNCVALISLDEQSEFAQPFGVVSYTAANIVSCKSNLELYNEETFAGIEDNCETTSFDSKNADSEIVEYMNSGLKSFDDNLGLASWRMIDGKIKGFVVPDYMPLIRFIIISSIVCLLIYIIHKFNLKCNVGIQLIFPPFEKRHKIAGICLFILISIMYIISVLLSYGVKYLIHYYEGVSINQLLFQLSTPLTGTNWSAFYQPITICVVVILLALICVYIVLYRLVRVNVSVGLSFVKAKARIGLNVILLIIIPVIWQINAITKFDEAFDIKQYLAYKNSNTTLYDDYYVSPNDVALTFPEQKRNLIYIYMESGEISASSKNYGGGFDADYIPELTQIALNNIDFSDEGVLNGAYVTEGSSWTIAGMIGQTAGIPLNYYSGSSFPGVVALGDILEDNGYANYLMIGSDGEFAGRTEYFKLHGDYSIYDYYTAIERGDIPSDYFVWWGFEDKKLYEFAEKELLNISKNEQPFNYTMLTVDTHFTDGYVCDLCEDTYEHQYANVLNCASKQLNGFFGWLEQQDFYDNTTVIISGDHLYMAADFYYVDESYDRRTYVSIINAPEGLEEIPHTYCTLDLFPTTLSSLGVDIEGDRLGLGTNLFSDQPTLIEEKGLDWINGEIAKYSAKYNSFYW